MTFITQGLLLNQEENHNQTPDSNQERYRDENERVLETLMGDLIDYSKHMNQSFLTPLANPFRGGSAVAEDQFSLDFNDQNVRGTKRSRDQMENPRDAAEIEANIEEESNLQTESVRLQHRCPKINSVRTETSRRAKGHKFI
eukprot:TRINITY_DN5426_c0_g1_i1.p1 TRINITY_DN5426_c0_g1~~TRINITY_DN5426_c0_g1_i1.p1  ORF type:complete len:142 (-),score=32.70 TRINITY_DN5426_c0_g1_i1:41-466(-)